MKLIVQIPCLNEAESIGDTVRSIPRKIEGISQVEILVIDDGSRDETSPMAQAAGADHIIRLRQTQGLANAFMSGLEEALRLKADIIVNLDADNQYDATEIASLIRPILEQKAQIVIGDRQVDQVRHFGPLKRFLQKFGSRVVSTISGLKIKDAVSGFRAFDREAALRINLKSHFSHTLETIIFAAKEHIPVTSVPIKTNPMRRPSRLAPNMWSFIKKSIATIIRVYLIYEPFKFFLSIGSFSLLIGIFPLARFLFYYFTEEATGHIQSLIFGTVFFILGLIAIAIGLLADLMSINRKLIEKQYLEAKRLKHNL